MKPGKKWVAFVTAPDQITGEMWCTMLRASGVNCRLQDSNPSFIGPSLYPVRLLALEEESDLALRILQNDVELGPKNESRAMRERQDGQKREALEQSKLHGDSEQVEPN